MEIDKKYKNPMALLNNNDIINIDNLRQLLDNCCKILAGQKEVYDISTLSQGHTTEIAQLYASLLYIFTQSVRNNQSNEEFVTYIVEECHIEQEKAKVLEEYYRKWFTHIRIQLLNIGNHLPHITNVRWKIDYVVKSSSLDQWQGPIFRVSLKTEKYDQSLQGSHAEYLEFTCNSQEMQDLVYKLKDAVRHCQKLAAGH